jgi:hypothetical protein
MDREAVLRAVRFAVVADPSADLQTGLAAAVLRYAVLTRGSVPRWRLLSEVAELLAPLAQDDFDLGELIDGELEALLSLGDLVTRQPAAGARVLIEPARPSFATIEFDGAAQMLVLGGSVDGRPTLPTRISGKLRARGRARWLDISGDAASAAEELRFLGLAELRFDRWAHVPEREALDDLAAPWLEQMTPLTPERMGSLDVFDPGTPATYFRGRLRKLPADAVRELCTRYRFIVARDVDADQGTAYSLLTLRDGGVAGATLGTGVRGRDVWLRLAAAVCRVRDEDGWFRCERDGDILRLYFPPPSWLDRLLTAGVPVQAGGLCAFKVPPALWPEVERALRDGLQAYLALV